jgi:hypothetical protein
MQDLIQAKTKFKAVVAAFEVLYENEGVNDQFPYNDCWIHANDWARIIACEFDLGDDCGLNGTSLVGSLPRHASYENLRRTDGCGRGNKVFYYNHRPRGKPRDHWLFSKSQAEVQDIAGTVYGFDRFVDGDFRKRCAIPLDAKSKLAEFFPSCNEVAAATQQHATSSSAQPASINGCNLKLPPYAGSKTSPTSPSSPDRSLQNQKPAAISNESPSRALDNKGLAHALIPPSIPPSSSTVRQRVSIYEGAKSPERQDRDKRRKPGTPPSRYSGQQATTTEVSRVSGNEKVSGTMTEVPRVSGNEKVSGISMPPATRNHVTKLADAINNAVLSPTSGAVMKLAPKKGLEVVKARADKQELGWIVDSNGSCHATATAPMRRTSTKTATRDAAGKLEALLGSFSGLSTSGAVSILHSMLMRGSDGMTAIRDELKSALARDVECT